MKFNLQNLISNWIDFVSKMQKIHLVMFYGILTYMGYLKPDPVDIYIYIYIIWGIFA